MFQYFVGCFGLNTKSELEGQLLDAQRLNEALELQAAASNQRAITSEQHAAAAEQRAAIAEQQAAASNHRADLSDAAASMASAELLAANEKFDRTEQVLAEANESARNKFSPAQFSPAGNACP